MAIVTSLSSPRTSSEKYDSSDCVEKQLLSASVLRALSRNMKVVGGVRGCAR